MAPGNADMQHGAPPGDAYHLLHLRGIEINADF
jgi:hypothetical protein